MVLIDTKLRTIVNNSYTGSPELTDGDGLRVRITQKGTITFQFCYRWQNKPIRLTLGRYPSLILKNTRIIVVELSILYDKGTYPKTYFTSSSDSKVTLNYCLNYWMERYVSTLREKTAGLYNAVVYKSLYNQFIDLYSY